MDQLKIVKKLLMEKIAYGMGPLVEMQFVQMHRIVPLLIQMHCVQLIQHQVKLVQLYKKLEDKDV